MRSLRTVRRRGESLHATKDLPSRLPKTIQAWHKFLELVFRQQ